MDGSGVGAAARRIEGVVIGVLVALVDGVPLVSLADEPEATFPARALATLPPAAIGAEVAVMFEGGDPARPLILGHLTVPSGPEVIADGARVRVTASDRIELRVGKASIILEKDGRITIRGSYVTSHASATMRIRGGSVNLN